MPDSHEIASGLIKGTVEIAPGLGLAASWVHYGDDAITPDNPQYGRVERGADFGDGNIPVDVFRTVLSDTVQGTLSYKPEGNNWIDGNLQTYWTRNKVEEDYVDSDRTVSREVETIGVKVDNRTRFDLSETSKLTLTYGAEYYQDEQVSHDNTSADGGRDGVPGATADFAGVFAQAEWKVTSPAGLPGELTIIPGARFASMDREPSTESLSIIVAKTADSPAGSRKYDVMAHQPK